MNNKYRLLTKCEVRRAGYRPRMFLRVYGPRWSIRQSSLNKDLLYAFRGTCNFSCGTQRVVPSGQDSAILPARVANHSTGFGSS